VVSSHWCCEACTVKPVVGTHHGPRPGIGDDALERGEVDLAQCPLVDVGADPQPIGLLIVGGIVLDRRTDAPALQTLDMGGAEDARQQRVLREVLEVASA